MNESEIFLWALTALSFISAFVNSVKNANLRQALARERESCERWCCEAVNGQEDRLRMDQELARLRAGINSATDVLNDTAATNSWRHYREDRS